MFPSILFTSFGNKWCFTNLILSFNCSFLQIWKLNQIIPLNFLEIRSKLLEMLMVTKMSTSTSILKYSHLPANGFLSVKNLQTLISIRNFNFFSRNSRKLFWITKIWHLHSSTCNNCFFFKKRFKLGKQKLHRTLQIYKQMHCFVLTLHIL